MSDKPTRKGPTSWLPLYFGGHVHPSEYPHIPNRRAKWWEFWNRKRDTKLDHVFQFCVARSFTDEDCQNYWLDVRRGQSPYEDAGGAMIRHWKAAFGEAFEAPPTYDEVVADLMEQAQ